MGYVGMHLTAPEWTINNPTMVQKSTLSEHKGNNAKSLINIKLPSSKRKEQTKYFVMSKQFKCGSSVHVSQKCI